MALSANGITVQFGPTTALSGVDFSCEFGEVHALVGENGSGKSTMMRVLAGELRPDQGSMTLEGRPYAPGFPQDSRRSGVALIHQELALCPDMSVAENIVLGVEPARGYRFDRLAAERLAADTLASMGYGEFPVRAKVAQLPIALRQIVEIGRAIANNARIILFDEPTSSLTRADVAKLFDQIRRLREEGRAIVYISHFLDEIMEIADRATILRDGQLVDTVRIAESNPDQIVSLMVGRDLDDLYPRSERRPGEEVLSCKGVTGRKLPVNASLSLRRGEVVGIAGLNGAGRTELARILVGLDKPRQGEVAIKGRPDWLSPAGAWMKGMGLLSEDRKAEGLALTMSIQDNIVLPKPGFLIQRKDEARRGSELVQRMRIKCASPQQAIGKLSGGNQQKAAIARLLDMEADILILDEPTRGIDVGSKAEIYALIDELAQKGCAILMISSYLPELLGVCDRIAVMSRGQLFEPVPVSQTNEHELLARCASA